jgi:hypothetical protein
LMRLESRAGREHGNGQNRIVIVSVELRPRNRLRRNQLKRRNHSGERCELFRSQSGTVDYPTDSCNRATALAVREACGNFLRVIQTRRRSPIGLRQEEHRH